MTTRLRARWGGAAVVIALTGATLAVSATPAAAAPPAIRIESVSSESVRSGESVRVRFRATNNDRRTARVFVAVSGGLRCTAGCSASPDLGPGRSKTFEATVVAPEVSVGQESGRNLAVSVRVGTQTAFDHRMIMVRGGGAEPPSAVQKVSGRVRDAGGKAIGGASLTVRDSAGHEYRTTSGGGGKFSIKSSDSRPIAAGSVTVVARKDGYRTARATAQVTAGGTATVRLTLTAVATPSPTPPKPTATASPLAVAEEPEETTSSTEAAPPAATVKTAGDEGSGPLLFTLLGGLLIAAGLGALVLMLIRRRRAPEPLVPAPSYVGAPAGDAPTAVLRAVPPDGGFFGPPGDQQHGYDPDGYGGYGRPAR